MFKAHERNPLFYLISPLKINPELKIADFRAKLRTYLQIYATDLDHTQKEMIQTILESLNTYFIDERF